jgi:hypothetical protein
VKFPDYVPLAVQQYITALLYGSGNKPGWVAIAKEPGNEYIAEVVAFLQRFEKKDVDIEKMFSHLNDANLSDADKKLFVNFAWAALTDYGKYRDAVKKAEKLNQDIAIKAEELAGLLDAIQGHGLSDVPIEFYDVRTLLRETDNPNDLTWRGMNCDNLTGGSAGENALYAWGIAPSLAELLGTVAKAASNYEPQFYGRIGAAVGRQHNPKTEYLRAFGHLLAEARIERTPAVLNAVACIATVAINGDPATYDDVKQALGLKQKPAG